MTVLPKCPATGKSSYRGQHEALRWARGNRHYRSTFRAYPCTACGRWHLTTQPRDRLIRLYSLFLRTQRHTWSPR